MKPTFLFLAVAVWPAVAVATQTTHSANTSNTQADSKDNASKGAALNRLITRVVLESVPHTIHDDKDWGAKVRRFNGVRLRREGMRLETKRDWVDVNHGVWRKASATLVDPENQFSIELKNVRPLGPAETAFDVTFRSPIKADVRQSHWVQGVQLYSVSADLSARVNLTLSCTLGVQWDISPAARSVKFQPRVLSADLQLENFAIERVGDLGGEVAQQVTRWAESYLRRHTESHEKAIVEKLNEQIAKESENWQISLAEFSETAWGKVLLKVWTPPDSKADPSLPVAPPR